MKYNQEIIEEICQHLRDGKTRIYAITKVGIDYQTFLDWTRGKIPKKALTSCKSKKEIEKTKSVFSEAIKKAERQGVITRKGRAIDSIMANMEKQWTAAAWWLERKHPDEFAEKKNFDLTTLGDSIKVVAEIPAIKNENNKVKTSRRPTKEVSPKHN